MLAIPTLEKAAGGGPLFFPGDMTDQGTPFETGLVKRIVHAGKPFVFVTGNHDSDVLTKQLVKQGAIVLTQRGQMLPDGKFGPVIVRAAGLRVAGYSDPFERFKRDNFQSPPLPHRATRVDGDARSEPRPFLDQAPEPGARAERAQCVPTGTHQLDRPVHV